MSRSICSIWLFIVVASVAGIPGRVTAQGLWHNIQRTLRYRPDGKDFVITNGGRRFNRALYGTHTAFRVEGGDKPEFALYMPGMGGNLKFGLSGRGKDKWLIDARTIRMIYRPGSLLYEISDPILGEKGVLHVAILALAASEGLVVRISAENTEPGLDLYCVFGGACGKKFQRDGDIGADPESSFDLKPEYCIGDRYEVSGARFILHYGSGGTSVLHGIFPEGAGLRLVDATKQNSPRELYASSGNQTPATSVVIGRLHAADRSAYFFLVENPASVDSALSPDPSALFRQAEAARDSLASRVVVNTPDPFINTLGGALSVAADGIWSSPSYMHGAVAWRIRLPGWRGPYVADPLGWHDRAATHFSSYALSQLTSPDEAPVVFDTALHLARQLERTGTSMFSSGYICRNPGGEFRPNHYDMNLVYIDELLDHFQWTGDTAYARKMWPVIRRHLAWERRNFDPDDDGLFDAYCCIWASDALQYSGGGVTHSSAYNYRANRLAASLARLIGEDPAPYRREADKIRHAINTLLWMPVKGSYAEYLDRPVQGRRLLHPSAGLWTIYHSIDSEVPDAFQAWQALRYVDTDIPHIPIRAAGLTDTSLYTLATTDWLPYAWSLNNVVMAESLHTALAYWQGRRPEDAFPLWKGALVESMYLGASPGNFQQLSFYDAMKGELYRDFADPIGMAARSLVEGLFGIQPDALHDTLTIRPGWPMTWRNASLKIPDLRLDYLRQPDGDSYLIQPAFERPMHLKLLLRARSEKVAAVRVDGRPVNWTVGMDPVNDPELELNLAPAPSYRIEVIWRGEFFERPSIPRMLVRAQTLRIPVSTAKFLGYYDPQNCLEQIDLSTKEFRAKVRSGQGDKTFFLHLQQGEFQWWQPLCFMAVEPIVLDLATNPIRITNNTDSTIKGRVVVNFNGKAQPDRKITIAAHQQASVRIPAGLLRPGHNDIRFRNAEGIGNAEGADAAEQVGAVDWDMAASLVNWKIAPSLPADYQTIDLTARFNDQVTNIFRNKYLSPRPVYPTLQLPWQGIGNWCYPLIDPEIDDSGLRHAAGSQGRVLIPPGIPFATPGESGVRNIAFTSHWDNYPDSVTIPLAGKAAHAYLMLAGSTDPMQSRMTNGTITVYYTDGSTDVLALNNPRNWWPIEQDDYVDGFAFSTGAPRPLRLCLKTGKVRDAEPGRSSIKGFSDTGIDGGAAAILDLPLHPDRPLNRIVLRTVTNDVVIGLMSLTLLRNGKTTDL